jgi:hypothetical protein
MPIKTERSTAGIALGNVLLTITGIGHSDSARDQATFIWRGGGETSGMEVAGGGLQKLPASLRAARFDGTPGIRRVGK